MVIRTELSRARPDVVREVFRMLKESRDRAVRAGNKNAAELQYGVEPNRRSLESIIAIAFEQTVDVGGTLLDDVARHGAEAAPDGRGRERMRGAPEYDRRTPMMFGERAHALRTGGHVTLRVAKAPARVQHMAGL